MKFVFLSAFLVAASSSAFAFECNYKGDGTIGLDTITLSAELNQSTLVNLKIAAGDSQDTLNAMLEATAAAVPEKPYVRPSKYSKDYYRYDLTDLKDTKGNSFWPGSECYLELHVPKTLTPAFTAPVFVKCDQSGGTVRMECKN